jgi:hypothetical protein
LLDEIPAIVNEGQPTGDVKLVGQLRHLAAPGIRHLALCDREGVPDREAVIDGPPDVAPIELGADHCHTRERVGVGLLARDRIVFERHWQVRAGFE